jgi:co-chaperonin GroES (HSP10)
MEKLTIKPEGFNVLAEVTELPNLNGEIYIGSGPVATKSNIEYYYGSALKLGDKATEESQCPELKEGENIIFSQFAGYGVPTTDGYCKIIRGHDIVAKVTSNFENMTEETVKPTGDRILVKIIGEGLVKDGIYDDSKEDPRSALTQKGEVISCGPEAKKYKKGTVVAFDPFCGNLILNESDCKLKTVNQFDILYTL